jgi:hypothetical protein
MRNPHNIAPEDHQAVPLRDAVARAVLIKARQAQIERGVATYLNRVDVLTRIHFRLSRVLAEIQRRAVGDGGCNA